MTVKTKQLSKQRILLIVDFYFFLDSTFFESSISKLLLVYLAMSKYIRLA